MKNLSYKQRKLLFIGVIMILVITALVAPQIKSRLSTPKVEQSALQDQIDDLVEESGGQSSVPEDQSKGPDHPPLIGTSP